MKVLYIGNYNDRTGWGNACLNNILALDSAGVNVVPRAITFNDSHNTSNQRIAELEGQSEQGVDVCIQHTLPPLYSYNSRFKNIGIFYTETATFSETMWHKHINLLDEAWVPNNQMITASQKSGVTIPVKLAPLCLPMEDYQNIEDCANVGEFSGCFNFCFVGEIVKRKNIETLLRAFHTEFHPSEPVNLFLKLSKPGYSHDETLKYFDTLSDNVKQALKIRKNYRKEIAITGHLESRHLHSLMGKCDCFVMPSFGEASIVSSSMLYGNRLDGQCVYIAYQMDGARLGVAMLYNEGGL
jgi:glycosyltransferase involved in cell wall biosynthesis